MTPANQPDGSVAASPARAANGLRTSRLATAGVDFVADSLISPPSALVTQSRVRSGRANSRSKDEAQRVASPISG
jgi:hypothetical protein